MRKDVTKFLMKIPVSLGDFLGDISSLKSEVQISYDQR